MEPKTGTIAVGGNIGKIEIGFICQICGNTQNTGTHAPIFFPVCDECKKDLKEIITVQRVRGKSFKWDGDNEKYVPV